jgi:hypothetical protein
MKKLLKMLDGRSRRRVFGLKRKSGSNMAKKAALCKHVHHLICVRVIDLRALHE